MLISETFHGYIETTQDALLIFESCRRGLLPKICRRLQERERKMIQSGSIFVFDERESGIKRWTDGRVWSPSRILGNFLIYREVDKKKSGGVSNKRHDRQLVGSLSDSFRFKSDGLIKKTMSLVVNGVAQHLISYYDPQEVMDAKLRTPSLMPELASLEISPELLARHHFRVPPTVEPSSEDDPSGQLTPPDSYDRHVLPSRSMSVGSIRRSSIGQSQLYHPYSHPQQHRLENNNNHNNNNTFNNNNNRPQSPITTYQHPLSSIPTNLYNTPAISNNSNNNHNNSININGFPTMPSPSSIGSPPMPSPVRSQSYQHQRHLSTTTSPRFDIGRQEDFERSHSLGHLHQDQIRLHPIIGRHSFDYYQRTSQDDLQFPF